MTGRASDGVVEAAAWLRARHGEAWAALGRMRGVRGLGIGLVGDGGPRPQLGWRVYVDADGEPPPVPEVLASFRTLVLPAAPSSPCYGDEAAPTLKPGIRIGIRGTEPGTLGCFARLKADPRKIVLLSNSHVLYSDSASLNGPGDGNAVGQPKVSCCWCCKCRVVAHNLRNSFHPVTVEVTNPPSDPETASEIDAAIAVLNSNRPYTNESDFYGMITGTPATGLGVSGGDSVEMVGFMSGHRKGRVLQFKTTAHYVRGRSGPVPDVLYPFASTGSPIDLSLSGAGDSITDLIIVPEPDDTDPTRKTAFAQGGDSGAVIVNGARQVVGILHSTINVTPEVVEILNRNATTPLPAHASVLGSACHIRPVLEALDIEIVDGMAGTAPAAGDELPVSEDALRREREEERAMEQALRELTREVKSRALGREVAAAVERHMPEVARLFDRQREVALAWHRLRGPAYAAHVLNSFRDHGYTIPADVQGVTPARLVARLAAVLRKHGSDALRAELDRYEPLALDWAADATSVWRLVDRLRRLEADEPPASDREVADAG